MLSGRAVEWASSRKILCKPLAKLILVRMADGCDNDYRYPRGPEFWAGLATFAGMPVARVMEELVWLEQTGFLVTTIDDNWYLLSVLTGKDDERA